MLVYLFFSKKVGGLKLIDYLQVTKSNFKKLYNDYDVVICVMRIKPKYFFADRVTTYHSPQLSPSKELLFNYLSRTKSMPIRFVEDCFDEYYTPRFMTEMRSSAQAHKAIYDIIECDKMGAKIAVVCGCKQTRLCHRGLLRKLIKEGW